ncbi:MULTISPECIES: VOC family protein [unclassified Corynebacterium]|uniref:VOC family protein n=1 Tax=unclassified Corynebacterium TaxID=2624378 RepID=UPI0026494CA7|nr:VOC family protein [Corynebacterium sp.]MDN5720826.1 VOC family protein [Corynebacterium sp.]
MSTWLNPYLKFRDTAADALAFYAGVFGGKADVLTFGQAGAADTPERENLVMHGHLETPDGWTFMACDTADADPRDFEAPPVDLCVGGDADEYDKVAGWFAALSEGGSVFLPLEKQMWGDWFGQVRDKFGVSWMVNVAADGAAGDAPS